jgi:hypothetical protein
VLAADALSAKPNASPANVPCMPVGRQAAEVTSTATGTSTAVAASNSASIEVASTTSIEFVADMRHH